MKDRIFIIDGSSYLYRAYHAMPPLTTSDGRPTGAIKGVTNMLMTLKKDSEGSPIIVTFDAKGKTFRNDIYDSYKANRPPMPDDLREQLVPLKNVCRAIGFPLIEIEGVEADDVIATFNYSRGEDTKSAAKGLITSVKEIKKDGDHRVIFELESGNADFPYIVSDYHFMIMASDGDGNVDATQQDNSTGGYMLQKYEPGVRSTFIRNPNYWKEGHAHFDEVEIISILDGTARQSAVMNGDVDLIDNVDPKTVDLLARVPSLNILETTGTQHYTFPMRLNVEPFGNAELRTALKYAIDRDELVEKILLGHGVVGNDIPVSAAMPFLNTDIAQRTFDPEKAAAHYKKSGHSGPIQLSVADAAFPGAVDAGQLIAASAKKAGIDIELVREPNDGYWSNVWNKKGWCACYWGGRPTQDWMYSSAYTSDNNWNDTAWRDTPAADRFNAVITEARSETDEAKRGSQYFEAQQLLHDDGGAIVAMWANYIHAHSKKLTHGPDVAANWINDGNKASERWWFA